MYHALTILALVALAAGNPLTRPFRLNPYSPNGQIIGGREASIEEAPHQVALELSGFQFCGGSIVSEQWVVTAGHCMAYPAESITVKAGTATKSAGGSLHQVVEVIRHELYSTSVYGVPQNDVAVLRVGKPFQLDDSRKPIAMFDQDEEAIEGVSSSITGWGATQEGGSTTDQLMIVDVPIVSKSECNEAYEDFGGVPKGQICAAVPQGGKDACQGDSGGPLTIGGRLAGIVSWGNGCARAGYPGVHTEVAAYRDWIASKIGV